MTTDDKPMTLICRDVLRLEEIEKMARLNHVVPSDVVLELVKAYGEDYKTALRNRPSFRYVYQRPLTPLVLSRAEFRPIFSSGSEQTLTGAPRVKFKGVHFKFEKGTGVALLVRSIKVSGVECLAPGSDDAGISAETIEDLTLDLPPILPANQVAITLRSRSGGTFEAGAMLMGFVDDEK